MLEKFLNGPRWEEIYYTNHWISQKIKNTNWYIKKRNSILEEYQNYSIEVWEKIDITKYDTNLKWEIVKESINFEFDLFFSIHNTWTQRYLYKSEDWKLYSIIKFTDTYNFPEKAEYHNLPVWTLNFLWYYHESKLNWETYDFTIEIIELIE